MADTSLKTLPVTRIKNGVLIAAEDCLINETPVSLVYNGISHVVLMATGQDLEELALGFSLTEGILDDASQLYGIDVEETCAGTVVNLEIATQQFQELKGRRRNMSGRTGCGLCGIESLDAVKPEIAPVQERRSVEVAHIRAALEAFDGLQVLRSDTGSVHGAAWVNDKGEIVKLFEDAGRHNALDKLIGYGAREGFDWGRGFVLVSSRASYEMVVKSAVMGIGCLVAVSAPTALAVSLAKEANMTLVGFAKPHQQVVYTDPTYLIVSNEQ
jgi:FdhD protein